MAVVDRPPLTKTPPSLTQRCYPALLASCQLAIALYACLMSGCFWFTSKHEGQTLRKDVNRIDAEVKSNITVKVVQLQKVLDEATRLLQRNSANLGSNVDELGRENAKLTGLVMEAKRIAQSVSQISSEHQKRLSALEQRLADLEQKVAKKPPPSPEQLFGQAKILFDSEQFLKSRDLFKQIITRYPNSHLASEAQYYRAETYFREGSYQAAIGEFQKIYDKYKNSKRVGQALFRAGKSAENLAWCTDARAYYGLLLKKYPRFRQAKAVKKRLTQLKKSAHHKKLCKS